MSIQSKTKIYKALARPTIAYAAETRADSVKTKQLVRTTEMRILRSIAGKTFRDRIFNKRTREMCDINDMVKFAKQKRKGWNDHVSQMDAGRLARIAKNERPQGRRLQGRPPKWWAESWQSSSLDTP